ncbi:hypothetical protein PILCRDRAFT_8129 [Piloderma croceum F 1598]|uniref:Uncharacterized protein n=1 Tax=Piloderma croceum (strain F 1598) TaxID=765440 RepID=A0A0C3BY76_PILCF|nr:hypothetical protein PILCRDRAFT_8129 [Piloderma croceum F 1598]
MNAFWYLSASSLPSPFLLLWNNPCLLNHIRIFEIPAPVSTYNPIQPILIALVVFHFFANVSRHPSMRGIFCLSPSEGCLGGGWCDGGLRPGFVGAVDEVYAVSKGGVRGIGGVEAEIAVRSTEEGSTPPTVTLPAPRPSSTSPTPPHTTGSPLVPALNLTPVLGPSSTALFVERLRVRAPLLAPASEGAAAKEWRRRPGQS